MLMKNWGVIIVWLLVTLSVFVQVGLIGGYTIHLYQAIQLLTGNFLIDAFITIIVTAPYFVPITLVISFIVKTQQLRFGERFLISLACVYSVLSLISIISQLTVPLLPFFLDATFQYIRESIGSSFLAAILSVFCYHRTSNFILKNILAFGICSPIILVPIIPWSLEIHGLSWTHLFD
jgi:hypothetical protein